MSFNTNHSSIENGSREWASFRLGSYREKDVLVVSLELNVHLGKWRLWTTEVFS